MGFYLELADVGRGVISFKQYEKALDTTDDYLPPISAELKLSPQTSVFLLEARV